MDLVRFLGDILAKEIEKPEIACRGIIRLAVKLDFPEKTIESMSFEDLMHVFKNGLKKKLEIIGEINSNAVSQKMIKELTKKQSILTFTR